MANETERGIYGLRTSYRKKLALIESRVPELEKELDDLAAREAEHKKTMAEIALEGLDNQSVDGGQRIGEASEELLTSFDGLRTQYEGCISGYAEATKELSYRLDVLDRFESSLDDITQSEKTELDRFLRRDD